jgi:hypothetical protein
METMHAGMLQIEKEINEKEEVQCCLSCKLLAISNDAEHEDGGGNLYCLWDGNNTCLYLKCGHYNKDEDNAFNQNNLYKSILKLMSRKG